MYVVVVVLTIVLSCIGMKYNYRITQPLGKLRECIAAHKIESTYGDLKLELEYKFGWIPDNWLCSNKQIVTKFVN